jgi:plasmid stabilization system protein ParE
MALMIKWNKRAVKQLDEAMERIEKESPINAEKVKREILLKIDAIPEHPEKHNPDKYKTNNDGSFRAFEMHHFRVSYRYKNNEIRIIRLRHTKKNPLGF